MYTRLRQLSGVLASIVGVRTTSLATQGFFDGLAHELLERLDGALPTPTQLRLFLEEVRPEIARHFA